MSLAFTDIAVRLKRIFQHRFDIDLDSIKEDITSKEFLGRDIGMAPRDLLYLYFDIEKEFGITIPQEAVVEGRFNTLNHVVDLIMNELTNKEKMAV